MEDRMVNKHKGAKMVNNNSKLLMDHLRMDLPSKDPHLKANAEVIINNLKMMDKLQQVIMAIQVFKQLF